METGSISAQLWDELFQPDVLGTLQPTAVIARATIASIRQMKDALVAETIVEFFKTLSPPKKTKVSKSKEWFDLLKKECKKLIQVHLQMKGRTRSQYPLRLFLRWTR